MLAMTIDGKAAETVSAFDIVNPATGEVTAQAPECSPDQLDQALTSAQRAQVSWRVDADARSAAMRELADAILANADELTRLLQSETGKPTPVAGMEPAICAAWLHYYAEMQIPREVVQDDEVALVEVAYRPHGVVAAITPWNFPLGLGMWKLAPALRAGNSVVIKPSPYTPLAALRLGQIMGDVLPAGVVNTVTGGDHLGAALVSHRIPRKISFTGSVASGKKVAQSAAADLKRMTLELGGNDAAIILDDAPAEATVSGLLQKAFFNSGQACALPKRIFAPAARYEEFVEAFAALASTMTVGDPTDASTQLGPLTTKFQMERVDELVGAAVAGGARVAAGGHRVDGPGFFYEPTILADVAEGDRIVDEEQFGLALPILRYDSVEDAVQRANDSEYGLCGSVWSADADRATVIAEQLEVGTTFVNTHADLSQSIQFGGAKSSGLGVENGVPGLLSFTEAQVVHRRKG